MITYRWLPWLPVAGQCTLEMDVERNTAHICAEKKTAQEYLNPKSRFESRFCLGICSVKICWSSSQNVCTRAPKAKHLVPDSPSHMSAILHTCHEDTLSFIGSFRPQRCWGFFILFLWGRLRLGIQPINVKCSPRYTMRYVNYKPWGGGFLSEINHFPKTSYSNVRAPNEHDIYHLWLIRSHISTVHHRLIFL